MFMTRIENEGGAASSQDASSNALLWPALVTAMIAEVQEGATSEQAQGLFRSLGGRIAVMISIEDIRSLDSLCDHINILWAQLGFGHVAMTLDDAGIDLRHSGVPHMPSPTDDGAWSAMIAPVLEGAYDVWFRAMGSSTKLRTRLVKQDEDCITLRHAA